MVTAIFNGVIATLDQEKHIFEPGYLVFSGDQITIVEKGDIPGEILQSADEWIDARNMLVIPGLVNAHTHLFQTFIRGLGDDLSLMEWLSKYIWPVAAQMSSSEAKLTAQLGLVENIRSGVTAVVDNQYIHNTPEMDEVYCQAADELGIRYLMARGWTDRNYHPAFLEKPEEIIDRVGELVFNWNHRPAGRVRVEVGPLSQIVVTDQTVQRMYQKAQEWRVGMQMHTSETQNEVETCLHETGMRPVEWLDRLGCLGPQVQLVHCVWLSDHEIDLVARRGATVVHCAVSNMYLASGAARIPEMVHAGIPIALGTDGPGSNNNQDMIETMKTTALLHKLNSLNAKVFFPEEILWMACRGGAQAFGQPELIGSLEVGKKADIVMVDLKTPFAAPVHRPVSALVFNLHGADVDTVIVDGKTLMKDKRMIVINENDLLEECIQVSADLMKRATS